jgi:hypothetical protein
MQFRVRYENEMEAESSHMIRELYLSGVQLRGCALAASHVPQHYSPNKLFDFNHRFVLKIDFASIRLAL